MYLARISLNPKRSTPMDQWASMGRSVREAVDPDPDSDARVLWARVSPTTLVVSSDTAPAWGKIPGAYAATMQPPPRHTEGETIRWELIAAPTGQRGADADADEPRPRGKRVALEESEFQEWIEAKTAGALRVTSARWKRLGGRPARYHFTGQAVVEDSEALQELCLGGIGAGRSTGAGLLLTSTAPTV
ncbi:MULTISPECIES: type I-E CRISPR-associated protein Cas6/Cse3/CasE [Nocardiopsidaceae]|uniref:Type I-E CRISPR-associated protein Cas6/Cse3/CasE n=2 Tax=Nocardiopsidaceae TaxID=83676 RepID=A0ABY6YVM7_9ACTN|nr:type I-E CRISPR-associated protein Cas6/Cse3/CasE [Streptomonospora nanhaiensis]WAE76046.1 type I-E CRISPR-associated protein Cas6/Cse3/CasE [Streptomonospora nanhaiensis]